MLEEIFSMIAAGHYWPAFAAGLMALTYLVRKGGADRALRWLATRIPGDDDKQLDHMRAWVPIGLAAGALGVALALPLGLDTAESALTALLAAVAAMAGHDVGKSLEALLRALVPSLRKPSTKEGQQDDEQLLYERTAAPPSSVRRRRASTSPGAGIVLVLALPLAGLGMTMGCVTPQSRPLASFGGPPMSSPSAMAETRAECHRLRERSFMTGAGASAAAALASSLGAVSLPVDRDGVELGLTVGAAVVAAVSAGLALLSTSYSGAMDAHCTPWPAVPLPITPLGDDSEPPDSVPPPPPPDRN